MKKMLWPLLAVVVLPTVAHPNTQHPTPNTKHRVPGAEARIDAHKPAPALKRPRLVVGIVVDQMRYDYLYRYWDKYPAGGFKRLLGEGFSYESCHYNYVPTYTGPGHASVYTGTTPATHGIIGNNWWVRALGRATYVTEDKTVQPVGGSVAAGQMSPRNMLTTTITDELRLASNFQSKVIGVCIKDRGSILPAGHAANAAYWYDDSNESFVTSTFYMPTLPEWVAKFNAEKRADQYLSKPWNTLLPIQQYTESTADDVPWESTFIGETKPVFPHDLPTLLGPSAGQQAALKASGEASKNKYESRSLIRTTPFGNSLTADFALAALANEQMGQRPNVTDFLALSFSSTDYVGHSFGPNSIEVEDTYLRLDRDLARLFEALDKQVGRGQSLVFLTADHAAAHAVGFLQAHRLPGGGVGTGYMRDSVQRSLVRRHGAGAWVLSYENQQVYLNRPLIAQKNLKLADIQDEVADVLITLPGVTQALSANDLQRGHWPEGVAHFQTLGFYGPRSGDVMAVLAPGWLEAYGYPVIKGTTHGSAGAYDTHVPLLFWGWGVRKGHSETEVKITDIAPTLARFLHIQEPSGTIGRPLVEVLPTK
ncbi:alkaline phosphatase family protein [Hymenobacter sp. ASUV-10]|uniref:Alkaline phosphatase family protein n=1 Tax=Hymenobacter aranciens TaxID=3063996 RepID=A0ABT9B530_9BACT|nr:alkaline phosphatase PafA [Hymenobacter sp. ASUV-10]MDO7873382.1 alkaline phosphatase family protein [Hymenobacter sp. ASUV-10]